MNRPPEILINNGFVTDQNGVLTEMVIPASVTTVQAPAKVTIYGDNISFIPSTTAALQILDCKGYPSFSKNQFKTYTSLNTLTLSNATGLTYVYKSNASENDIGFFNGLTSLTAFNAPNLITIDDEIIGMYNPGQRNGIFRGTGIINLHLPNLTTITHPSSWANGTDNGTFNGCTSLTTVTLPKIQSISPTTTNGGTRCGTFGNCNSLQSVTFGSTGHPVSGISPICFNNCTQSFTITVYTTGGVSLSGEPWGATNADTDIIYEVA